MQSDGLVAGRARRQPKPNKNYDWSRVFVKAEKEDDYEDENVKPMIPKFLVRRTN